MVEAQPNPDHPEHSAADGDAATSETAARIELARGVTVDRQALDFTFSRSSGPGGQSVNKLNTRAQLRVRVDDLAGLDEAAAHRLRRLAGQRLTGDDALLLQCDTHRSQRDNRRACVERLRELVDQAATPPRRRKRTRPSRGALQRRRRQKKEHREKKQRRRRNRNPGEFM